MSGRPRSATNLVPTQLAAMAAGVSEATIRKWASRGKLTRYGQPGKAEYDLREILSHLEGQEENELPPG